MPANGSASQQKWPCDAQAMFQRWMLDQELRDIFCLRKGLTPTQAILMASTQMDAYEALTNAVDALKGHDADRSSVSSEFIRLAAKKHAKEVGVDDRAAFASLCYILREYETALERMRN